MEYCSVEVLIHAVMWMNLENMLSEIRQTQKGKILYDSISVRCLEIGKFMATENGLEFIRDWGRKKQGVNCLVALPEFLFRVMKKLWKELVVMVSQPSECN